MSFCLELMIGCGKMNKYNDHDRDHKLFLHIGTRKTGSTALQEFLYQNQSQLEKNGWCYPPLAEEVYLPYTIANQYPLNNGWGLYEAFKDKDEKNETVIRSLMTCIADHLKRYNVIVSSESLWLLNQEEFFAEIMKYFSDVQVIVYLRRQDRLLESLYNQHVKSSIHLSEDIGSYVKRQMTRGIPAYLNKLYAIEKQIGHNPIVRVYEKKSFSGQYGDVVSDFCSVVGLDIKDDDWIRIPKCNESLTKDVLIIKRIFNSVYKNEYQGVFSPYDDAFIEVSDRCRELGTDTAAYLLTPFERKQILNFYRRENEEIARHFLGRSDGKLFLDMNTDILPNVHEPTAFEENMIRVFSLLLQSKNCN